MGPLIDVWRRASFTTGNRHRQAESVITAGHAIVLDPGKLCRKMGNAVCKRICMPTRLYSGRGGKASSGWTKEYQFKSARSPHSRHAMAIATDEVAEADLPVIYLLTDCIGRAFGTYDLTATTAGRHSGLNALSITRQLEQKLPRSSNATRRMACKPSFVMVKPFTQIGVLRPAPSERVRDPSAQQRLWPEAPCRIRSRSFPPSRR